MTDKVKQFMQKFEAKIPDSEIFIVGGAVRDIIMGKEPHDYDFATNVSVEEIEKHFKAIDIGQSKSFGIVAIPYDGEVYEVAQFRSDLGYSNNRHPDAVDLGATIQDDAERRDFTINAMYIGSDGKIVDFFDGQKDIKEGKLRAVGDPTRRIEEDALRILRAIRFEVVYDLWMEFSLALAIRMNRELVKSLSQERITGEIIKVASKGGKVFHRFLRRIDDLGLTGIIFPEIEEMKKYGQHWEHHPEGGLQKCLKTGEISPLSVKAIEEGTHIVESLGSVYDHVLAVIEALPDDVDEYVVLSALYHDIGKPITAEKKDEELGSYGFKMHEHVGVKVFEELAKKRKIGGELRDVISFVIERHMDANNQRLVKKSKISKLAIHPYFDILMKVARADDKSRGLEIYSEERFSKNMQKFIDARNAYIDESSLKKKISEFVDGNKIMKLCNLSPSKRVGEILEEIKDFLIENDFNLTLEEVDQKIRSLK